MNFSLSLCFSIAEFQFGGSFISIVLGIEILLILYNPFVEILWSLNHCHVMFFNEPKSDLFRPL